MFVFVVEMNLLLFGDLRDQALAYIAFAQDLPPPGARLLHFLDEVHAPCPLWPTSENKIALAFLKATCPYNPS